MKSFSRSTVKAWLRRNSHMMFLLFVGIVAVREAGCGYRVDSPVTGSTPSLRITVTPKAATIATGATLNLSASVTGWKSDSTVQWSISGTNVGALTAAGSSATYTAPATLVSSPVIVTVMVRSNEDTSRVAYSSITIAKPVDTTQQVQILLTPLTVSLQVGKTQPFTATVTGSSNTAVTWALISGPGSISSTGLYTTPASITGTSAVAVIKATAAANVLVSAQATITILPPPDTTPCFTRDIQPIINSNCTMAGCHVSGGGEARDLTTYNGIMSYVRAGTATSSKLYTVLSASGENFMPRGKASLTAAQKSLIARWINAGAKNTACPVDTSGGCDTSTVLYSGFVAPTLQNYCLGCHSGTNPSGGINLATYSGVQTVALNGQLVGSLNGTPPNFIMPQTGAPLDACTIAKIRAWVNHGALNN